MESFKLMQKPAQRLYKYKMKKIIIALALMLSFGIVGAQPQTWTTTETRETNVPGWYTTTATTWTMNMYNQTVYVSSVVTTYQR